MNTVLGDTKMLIIATILFSIAVLLFTIDKLLDSAEIDLAWPVRILVTASAALILLNAVIAS